MSIIDEILILPTSHILEGLKRQRWGKRKTGTEVTVRSKRGSDYRGEDEDISGKEPQNYKDTVVGLLGGMGHI